MKLKSVHKKIIVCVTVFVLAIIMFCVMPWILINTNFFVSFFFAVISLSSAGGSIILPLYYFGEFWWKCCENVVDKFNNWISEDDK